jgi:Macrocin-O-methyltransferase (TylF)
MAVSNAASPTPSGEFCEAHAAAENRGAEVALLSVLRKAKDDGSSVILRTRKPDGTSVPVAEMRNFTEVSHTMVGRKRLDNIQLAVLRLDGDLYESTMDALVPLYDKVSTGGFVIVDDDYSCAPCGRAIDEFRATRGISTPLQKIDEQSVFWRKG